MLIRSRQPGLAPTATGRLAVRATGSGPAVERFADVRLSALLAAGLLLMAINMRPAAASVGPLLGRIEAETGLSSEWAGALTTLPVLCFGAVAPLAPLIARRLGVRASIAGAMTALLAGMLIRLIPGVHFLFVGTALAAAAIATCNVLQPVLVRRDFAQRPGTATALFSTGLMAFAALAAGATVPLANALGGGWRPGLAVWVIPAAVAALAWLPALLRRDARPRGPRCRRAVPSVPPASRTARTLLYSPLAWQVTLFFALQAAGFYATLAWLPSVFRTHGASEAYAGVLLSVTLVVGLLTALAVPGLAARSRDQRGLVAGACALTAAGLMGILIAPMSAPYVWAALLGLGQNAAFPLALMLIVLRGGTVANTESLSTLAQSVGYALAAFAPLAVGALHSLGDSWTPALILLCALVVPQLLTGLAAGRDVQLPAPNPPPDQPPL